MKINRFIRPLLISALMIVTATAFLAFLFSLMWGALYSVGFIKNRFGYLVPPNPLFLADCHYAENEDSREFACRRAR